MDDRWLLFADGLARTLADLADRSVLTISWASVPTAYVQFAQTGDGLTARTGADDVLESARPSQLAGLGWQPPETDPRGRRTWHATLDWPARSRDYALLADRCVRTLAEVHQVLSPDELEYRAVREGEEPPENVTFYDDELEPAEPHLICARLGIRDANTASADD